MASETGVGTRWEDLPADEQQDGYWMAVRDCNRSGLCGLDYEVVFAAHDLVGTIVWRLFLGLDCESVRHWRFLRRLDLPASAAEAVAQAERDRHRKAVEAAVDKAGREMADESFVLPTTLRSERRMA